MWREYLKEASRCMIQVRFDIAFHDSLIGETCANHRPVDFRHHIFRGAAWSKAIRAIEKVSFPDGFEYHPEGFLYDPIFQNWNPHSTLHLYPSRLWNW